MTFRNVLLATAFLASPLAFTACQTTAADLKPASLDATATDAATEVPADSVTTPGPVTTDGTDPAPAPTPPTTPEPVTPPPPPSS